MTETRILLGQLITAQYNDIVNFPLSDDVLPTPNIIFDDKRYEPQGVAPLIKIYPLNASATPKGAGYTHRRVESRLSIDIRCRDQANSENAKEEVIRILGANRDHPWTGYDLIVFDDGTFRGGSTWMYQWVIEVSIYQMRKPVAT